MIINNLRGLLKYISSNLLLSNLTIFDRPD